MKYTSEIVRQIIKYIEAGNNVTTACRAVGLSRETFYKWLKDKDKSDISDTIIEKAEATAIIRNLTIIQLAANKNWQAAAWFLERKDFENWGRKELIGGIKGKPVLHKVEIEDVYGKNKKDKST